MTVEYKGDGNPDGTVFGQSGELIAFFGATPVVIRAAAAQGALALATATGTSGFGFVSSAAFDAFTAQLEEIRATLTALGLWTGSS